MLDASRDKMGFQLNGVGLNAVPPPSYASVQSSLVNGAVMRKSKDAISEEAIHDELSRILESSIFVQSDRLGRFLRFTVEKTLAGGGDMLKEYLIGTGGYAPPTP